MIDQRGQLLRAALGFAGLRDAPPDAALDRLHTWLDSWAAIGHVVCLMPETGEHRAEERARGRIVIGNKNLHRPGTGRR